MAQYIKTCAYCGKEFIANNARSKYCKGVHSKVCEVCGKEFEFTYEQLLESRGKGPRTCSTECRMKLMQKTYETKSGYSNPANDPSIQAKKQSTNLARYGTTHPMQSDLVKEHVKETNRARYGVDWALQSETVKSKSKQTMLDKYGVSSPSQSREIQDRMKATWMKTLGVDNPSKSEIVKERYRKNYQLKTGYTSPFSNPEVRNRIKQSFRDTYGCEYPLQNPEILKRLQSTNLTRYGNVCSLQSPDIVQHTKQLLQEKYGVDNAGQIDEGKAKRSRTMIARYGVASYSQTDEYLEHTLTDSSKLSVWKSFKLDPSKFITDMFDQPPTLLELAECVGVSSTTIGQYIIKHNCQDKIAYVYSQMEREVYQFLRQFCEESDIIRNTHRVITPYELDLYLPKCNLAIECNPTITHNSSIDTFSGTDIKSSSYHKMKSDMCERRGILLFHIFGYEWVHKRKIIESMLRNLLRCNSRKVYARNTIVKLVSFSQAADFLDANHRQGKTVASIRLGLYTKDTDELVSLMTFGHMRKGIGTGKEDLSDCYELVRFCNKLNTSVTGSASKLFKYFVNHYHPIRVRSFSDRAHTRGELYEILGFHEIRRSDPGYVWVDLKTDLAYHRMNAQKQNIRKFLKDYSIDIENLTEKEIMESHGYVSVYDSGTITWEYHFV